MTLSRKRSLVVAMYLLFALLPLLVMLFTPKDTPRGFLREFSVALGFLGFGMAGMQFLPISRLRGLSEGMALDEMFKFHHLASIASIFMILLHPLLLGLYNSNVAMLFKIFEAHWAVQAGWVGLFGLLFIGLTSVLRKMIKLEYSVWLIIHDILTALLLTFGTIHMFKINYYMNTPVMRTLWIIMIIIWALCALYIRLIRPIMVSQRPFKVAKVEQISPDTFSLYLEPDGHTHTNFRAGQVAWISKSPWTISRNPFSYSGSDQNKGQIRFSIKDLGDFTATIKDLKPGDRMYVDGPYGTMNLDDEKLQKGLIMFSGGIGVAPVMSIMNSLADRGDNRPVYCFYGDFSEKTMLFQDEFAELQRRLPNLKVITVLEKPLDPNYPNKGYINKRLVDEVVPADQVKELYYFMCGPIPMMNAMEKILNAYNIPASQVGEEKYEMA